jgi:hypothetical protein
MINYLGAMWFKKNGLQVVTENKKDTSTVYPIVVPLRNQHGCSTTSNKENNKNNMNDDGDIVAQNNHKKRTRGPSIIRKNVSKSFGMEYGSIEFIQYIANHTNREAIRQNESYQEMYRLIFLNDDEEDDDEGEQVRVVKFPRYSPTKDTNSKSSSKTASAGTTTATFLSPFQKTIPIKFANPPPVMKKPIQQKKSTGSVTSTAVTVAASEPTATTVIEIQHRVTADQNMKAPPPADQNKKQPSSLPEAAQTGTKAVTLPRLPAEPKKKGHSTNNLETAVRMTTPVPNTTAPKTKNVNSTTKKPSANKTVHAFPVKASSNRRRGSSSSTSKKRTSNKEPDPVIKIGHFSKEIKKYLEFLGYTFVKDDNGTDLYCRPNGNPKINPTAIENEDYFTSLQAFRKYGRMKRIVKISLK